MKLDNGCYVPVKSKLQHPPRATPPGYLNFWKILFKFPPPRAKKLFKCPTIRSTSSDQISPPPGRLLYNSAQRISSFTGTWLKESRLRRLQLLPVTKSGKCSASNIMKSLSKSSGIFHINTSSQTSSMNSLLLMSSGQDP